VTIDAVGCQKKNAKIIVDQGGDYLLAVKKIRGIFMRMLNLSLSMRPRMSSKVLMPTMTVQLQKGMAILRFVNVGLLVMGNNSILFVIVKHGKGYNRLL